MSINNHLFIALSVALIGLLGCQKETSLDGSWEFALDPESALTADSPFDDNIHLPGTTDLAGKGQEPESTNETLHLTRKHSYVGKAWYRRMITIPLAWKNKEINLLLERTKASTVFLDGKEIGSSNDISTPQSFNMGRLKPGLHSLAIRVDNGGGVPVEVIRSSHMYSEDTQTNWNGIIGKIVIQPASAPKPVGEPVEPPALRPVGEPVEPQGPARLEIIDNQFVTVIGYFLFWHMTEPAMLTSVRAAVHIG